MMDGWLGREKKSQKRFSLHSFLCLLHHTFDRILIAFVIIFAFCFSRSKLHRTRVSTEISIGGTAPKKSSIYIRNETLVDGKKKTVPKRIGDGKKIFFNFNLQIRADHFREFQTLSLRHKNCFLLLSLFSYFDLRN